MSEEIIKAGNLSQVKVPICYSVNPIEILQSLGNLMFASRKDSDKFMQKIIGLLKKRDTTKISRLATKRKEQLKCLNVVAKDFVYMGERLVIPKALRPNILRSLHYGHPGRYCMLATISNVWWFGGRNYTERWRRSCENAHNAKSRVRT